MKKILITSLLMAVSVALSAQTDSVILERLQQRLVQTYCDSLAALVPMPFSQEAFADQQTAFENRFFKLDNPLVDSFFRQTLVAGTTDVRREPWLRLFETTLDCPAVQTYLANGETDVPPTGVIAFEAKVCQCIDTMASLSQRDLEKMLENAGSSAATQAKITTCNNLHLSEFMTYLQKTYRNPQEAKISRDTRLGVAYMMTHSVKFVQAQAAVRVRAVLPPLQQAYLYKQLSARQPAAPPVSKQKKNVKKGG